MNPYLSIIIPAYNEENKIKDTLESIKDIKEIDEIIVVDDINQQTYNINQMFRNSIQEESNLIEFEIKNEKLEMKEQ